MLGYVGVSFTTQHLLILNISIKVKYVLRFKVSFRCLEVSNLNWHKGGRTPAIDQMVILLRLYTNTNMRPVVRWSSTDRWHTGSICLVIFFFSVRHLSVPRGHSVFSSSPQRPMTSDFEGFSNPDFIHYILFFSLS